ncbi:MAG: hypothetical protein FWG45_05110 [Oscillospiraceae bacterium]|nr:hypothetical protein [Oscillospiraceae bacterium]
MKKRIVSIILAAVLFVSVIPQTVAVSDNDTPDVLGVICNSKGYIMYKTTANKRNEFAVTFYNPDNVGKMAPVTKNAPANKSVQPALVWDGNWELADDFGFTAYYASKDGVLTFLYSDDIVMFAYAITHTADFAVAYQEITSGEVHPQDFRINPAETEGTIEWVMCECSGCSYTPPPNDCDVVVDPCKNCDDCGGVKGGRRGFGRITGNSEKPQLGDALAILRLLVGLSSPIRSDYDALAASTITNPGTDKPTMSDALAILRFVVGLSTPLDDVWA